MQYEELIKTVDSIVANHGEEILSSPKFWYILTDTYSFKNNYSLKVVFKKAIAGGYIERIVSVRNEPEAVKTKIRGIISSNGRSADPMNKEELKACLISVAVAVKACPLTEINTFLKTNAFSKTAGVGRNVETSKIKRKTGRRINGQKTPHKQSSRPTTLTSRLTVGSVILIVFGYILLAINIALFPACIKPDGLGFNVIGWYALISQILYIFIALGFLNPSDPFWPKDVSRTTFWCVLPILIIFILSDIFSLFFFIIPFKQYFSEAIWGQPYIIKTSPYSTSTPNPYFELGQVFLALLIPVGGWYALDFYSENKKLKNPRFPYDWRAFFISLGIILISSAIAISIVTAS